MNITKEELAALLVAIAPRFQWDCGMAETSLGRLSAIIPHSAQGTAAAVFALAEVRKRFCSNVEWEKVVTLGKTVFP